MNSWQSRESGRFGRFLAVGLLNTLLDFGLMNLFTQAFKWPLLPSQALSFILAVVNSYVLNSFWVYPEARKKANKATFVKFLLVNLAGLGLRSLLIPLLDRLLLNLVHNTGLKTLPVSPTVISHNTALALVIPLTLVLNFLANRYWTFKGAADAEVKDG